MACKLRAQDVAATGDNFMLPERRRRIVELCVAVKCERKTAIVARLGQHLSVARE